MHIVSIFTIMDSLFFDDFNSLVRIFIAAPLLYGIIIFYIRIFGKRTTSQMNSFDWIVTVALGSIVATTVIQKTVPLLSGALAILILMLLQYVLTKSMLYSKRLRKIIRSDPRLLVFKGEILNENMRKERIVEAEVYAAIREKGLANIKDAYAVILETDAQFSVIKDTKYNDPFSLRNVEGLPEEIRRDLFPAASGN